MMCGSCGEPLEVVHGTAYVPHTGRESQKGCVGRGYWSQERPTSRDQQVVPLSVMPQRDGLIYYRDYLRGLGK